MRIREASPSDAKSIASLLRAAFLEFQHLYTPAGFRATTPTSDELRSRFAEGTIWIAEQDEVVVGTVSVVLKGEGLYIRSMAVRPEARGGVAARLLEIVEQTARAHGCSRMFLSTTPFLDTAIHFYERAGFRRTGEGPRDLFGTPLMTMVKEVEASAMNAEETKYTRVEYERRFLVSPHADWRSAVEPYAKTFEDKYLRHGRLRLRILTDSDTGRRVIKLNKKLVSDSPYFRTVSRILLSPDEYELLDRLEGDRLRKVRHYHNYRGRVFSIDVCEGELDGPVLCETEAAGLEELMSIEPPPYATVEVTEDPFFTGGNLCRTTRADLLRKLSTLE